ncbi:MAG: undecaprenyl diphosphate synthase family protein, partial [Caldilineaceae bacterium]|nr:undecaprenyl diphosphate synthase family protein [Caldilineaceae bacterium]
LWPDFTETAFLEALDEFQRRSRRFGKTDEQLVADTAEGPSHTVAKLH